MPSIRLRSRSQTSLLFGGTVVGLLVAGLAIPYVFGESITDGPRESARSEAEVAAGGETGAVPGSFEPGNPAAGTPTTPATGATATRGQAVAPATGISPVARQAVAGATGPLRATDQGVSATAIKVGFLLLDTGSLGQFGITVAGVDPKLQEQGFRGFVEDVNKRGINGRKIEPVFRSFDVLSQDDQRAACLELTRDKKVFVVLAPGGYYGPPLLCVTDENKTMLINAGNQGTPSQYIERSAGRLFSVYPAGNRQMANWIYELDRQGLLRGKTIGVLTDELSDPGGLVYEGGLLPALKQFGYAVAQRARLSADLSVGASQMPVAVQEMRTAGVDTMLMPSGSLYNTQFAQHADGQRWYPKYNVTDFQSMQGDTTSQNMPNSWDGTTGITTSRVGEWRANVPETPQDAACRQLYEKAVGHPTPRNNGTSSNAEYTLNTSNCGLVRILEAAAGAAGPELTRASLSAAIQNLGQITPPGNWLGGTYRPGKFDLNDTVRTTRWFLDCKCWKPVDQPRPVRFT